MPVSRDSETVLATIRCADGAVTSTLTTYRIGSVQGYGLTTSVHTNDRGGGTFSSESFSRLADALESMDESVDCGIEQVSGCCD